MRDRRWALRLGSGAAALALALTACSGGDSSESSDGGSQSSKSSAQASEPGPPSTVKDYSLKKPKPQVEGADDKANKALRSFAEAMRSGDQTAVQDVLYAPTPEDQSIVDKSLRIYDGADWDFDGVRWTEDGVHGPCYLLQGEAHGEPVHMAGWASWNDTLQEWEFGTLGLPGSPEYPDVPSC